MQKVMITISQELLNAVDETAYRLGLNRSQFIRESLNETLNRIRQKEFEALMAEGYQEMAEENLRDAEAYASALLDIEGGTE
ncbi:ribbon-helix-helix protein, CopG family [Candidatus Poribacteria bacterium]|nr:ribbon-helix-helix protein, CopG family [Candidatus Poribacteria bacterium]